MQCPAHTLSFSTQSYLTVTCILPRVVTFCLRENCVCVLTLVVYLFTPDVVVHVRQDESMSAKGE